MGLFCKAKDFSRKGAENAKKKQKNLTTEKQGLTLRPKAKEKGEKKIHRTRQTARRVSFAGANWTDIEFAVEVDPEHKTAAEVYAPRTLRTIFITCPNPFLLIAKNRGYV